MIEEKVLEGMKYLISYPEGFQEDKKYPLVVFLHGAGTRSETTEPLRKNVCFLNLQKRQDERGYVLLAPLCKKLDWNEWMTILVQLVDSYRQVSYVDETRVYLTGNSMGGYGTWTLATLHPDWFASVMPVCGGGVAGFCTKLRTLPIRTFHGLRDETVDPFESFHMVKSVNMRGGHAELILFPELAHNCWDRVYSDERNYDWLLAFTTERDQALVEELSGSYYG